MTCDTYELYQDVVNTGAAIIYGLDLDENQFADMMNQFGDPETPGLFMNSKQNPEIFYVTNERDQEGSKIGMFGGGELGWHSNGNSRHNNTKNLVGLYCVEGDPNTTLSICNTSMVIDTISQDEMEYWRSIKIGLKFQNNTMYNLDDDDPELEFMSANRGSIRRLIGTHPITGAEYFYFPYHFIQNAWIGHKKMSADGLADMIERVQTILFKSRYMFHHIFKKGDLLLMDQLLTLHRRTPVMGPRLLWRVASDYSKI
jgi:hypothetical protein